MKDARELLTKFKAGSCTEEEKQLIEKWLLFYDAGKPSGLSEANFNQACEDIWENIQQEGKSNINKRRLWSSGFIKAAAILIVLGTGLWFFNKQVLRQAQDDSAGISLSKGNDIAPGTNKATLTLANGKVITLSGTKIGVVVNTDQLTYSDGSEVRVSSKTESLGSQKGSQSLRGFSGDPLTSANGGRRPDAGQDPTLAMNTKFLIASTPRGGIYQVILPDGTHIWLNAASSIKFPSTFAKLKERKVELTGEAYFVVKHNAKRPFRVETKGQVVEDIGTEFNINAYADETITKTTLIEGSAKVVALSSVYPEHIEGSKGVLRQAQHDMGQAQHDNGTILKPNQQSLLTNNGNIKITPANIEETIAWKNGDFNFVGEDMESIMRKLSRWYNVEVKYEGNITKEVYYGKISRNKNVSEVLKMLERAQGVHFKIEGRRITVMQ